MKTRAQEDMKLAYECVRAVAEKPQQVRQIYGGLCHSFPIFVRQCGLCQALAFSEDKATGKDPLRTAHALLLSHVAKLVGVQDKDALMERVRSGSGLDEYMMDTRRVLRSWIYFKRFAVSVLKVESARAADEETP